MKMRRAMHIVLYVLAAVAAAFLIFLLTAVITDYRPDDKEALQDRSGISSGTGTSEALPDSLSILCWNIGYGGLGDDMDFFYDGGTQVRTGQERTITNLDGIISEIRRQNADIVLLQEVDECSRRTYRINEVEMLRKAFPDYHIYMAYNYKSFFVPIPLKAPMGRVASGVVLMSRVEPQEVYRHQYPSRFPWPVSMFNLKRCLLTAAFRLSDGRSIVIGNTHNTAYDTGGMRTVETDFLGKMAAGLHDRGIPFVIGGDWNQYPASYNPSDEEHSNPHFSTVRLEEERLTPYGSIVYDKAVKTLRHLDKPYGPESVLTVTDYFYVSPGIRVDTVQAFDMSFKYSDHQPVLIKVSEIH
ncbi:MAG TPA: endonuclease/exonuclease/phosphatase family protein [Candidatus Coprenecus stercoravium]|uniref:Endonuclease/exonuclease/phosphatase family protein n=1 Tax=Candidatus Coprenecus stercoravium TaxID=2840735 RepID=A0A9D2K9C6_9BACT|nr:endonuclease/exonuclease/phosphatase family protein [Candidatus Coprenecus stercoravium]